MLSLWPIGTKPVIGMVHLLPLPGSPRYGGSFDQVRKQAIADAEALAAGGVHGLMLENFGDVPFFPGRVPAHVVACMTDLAAEIRRRCPIPLGINVLRNDGLSALAVALAADASFIRVNVLCGARVTDQGAIEGIAHDLQRLRSQLDAGDIRVLADVDVKHSSPLGQPRAIEDEAIETLGRGLADGLIVSGAGTGRPTDITQVKKIKHAMVTGQAGPGHAGAAEAAPIFVGSGVDARTVGHFLAVADGVIVGTALKRDGIATNPVDVERVKQLMAAAR